MFGDLNLMIWIAFALAVRHSTSSSSGRPSGCGCASVGEHPRAADTVGIDVYRTRYVAVTVSGHAGGAWAARTSRSASSHSFNENMTEGRGFIALAALIFGKWRPFGAFGAACLFGFSTALAQRLPDAYVDSASGTRVLFQTLCRTS